MTIDTIKFGVIDIEEDKIIVFDSGLLGFKELKRYTIIRIEETLPFYWIQAIDDKEVALPCMNPFDIMPSYTPLISKSVLDDLESQSDADLLVITTVVVPSDPTKATTNLAAPIIINTLNNKGVQFVLQNSDYDIRQSVFTKKEDTQYVDTFKEAK